MSIEKKILKKYPLENERMMSKGQVTHILRHLKIVLESNIEGDVVELGCHSGTTSLFIRRMLNHYRSGKIFHVYDSWQGLPQKSEKDGTGDIKPGDCCASKEIFVGNFKKWNLELPRIHSGWFRDIPDTHYPDKICFAFFDGDLYRSILDSFNKVYFKLSKNARLLIDDYDHPKYRGCQKACLDFFKDKPEKIKILKDNTGRASLGLIIKKSNLEIRI